MVFRRLLAKSSRSPDAPRPAETLPGHTANVMASAEVLLDEKADVQLSAVGLSPTIWKERFRRAVLSAAFCHDLGKANGQFQAMVRHTRQAKQAIRHEALSLLIVLREEPVKEWLSAGLDESEDLSFLLWAAAGHHRKFPPDEPSAGTGVRLPLYLGHSDFRDTLAVGADWLKLQEPPPLQDLVWKLVGPDSPQHYLKKESISAGAFWRDCSDEKRRFVAAVKACVVASDVAGSILPKTGEGIAGWIRRALGKKLEPNQLRTVVDTRLKGLPLRPFQQALGRTNARVVLAQAGCGTGKTLGAYVWAAERAPGKRLFFAYPTTGTATEGFRDYLTEPTLSARLVHSRASADLELLGVDDASEEADPLAALEAWSTPITSCTVDTVLGLTQNHKKALYAWPVLAGAAFVFDEIHAYDDRLYSSLLRFLSSCRGVPCLLMTASLPQGRFDALRELLSSTGESLDVVPGPTDLETLPRYRRLVGEDPWKAVEQTLGGDGKVLWVANTVNRALGVADEASVRGLQPLVYHSRFRYEDRVQQHKRVVDAFQGSEPVLAVTTQVAEMSLDLSADLLVTDLAPIASLVQRLGRLNRRAAPEQPSPAKPFLVITPNTDAPYTSEAVPDPFGASRQWLECLGTGAVSQSDLSRTWDALDDGIPRPISDSAWLDGGFETSPRHLREVTTGITVLLPPDAVAVERGGVDPVRVRIPMTIPHFSDWRQWRKVAFSYVPPAGSVRYDPERGARWNP